jgi:hypothetical protein
MDSRGLASFFDHALAIRFQRATDARHA